MLDNENNKRERKEEKKKVDHHFSDCDRSDGGDGRAAVPEWCVWAEIPGGTRPRRAAGAAAGQESGGYREDPEHACCGGDAQYLHQLYPGIRKRKRGREPEHREHPGQPIFRAR